MIDTETLRKKIINLAIQGKLTRQLPEDGNAEDLYVRIQEEKAKLINVGKIKKDKSLPAITDDETAFVIPNNWKWVRLGEITDINGGTTPKSNEVSQTGDIPYFKVSDMNAVGNEKLMVHAKHFINSLYTGKIFPAGTIIYPKNGGAALTNKRRVLITDSAIDLNTGGCTPIIIELLNWVKIFLETVDFNDLDTGSNIPTVNATMLKHSCIPLPPLSEQIRIADILDAIFAQIEIIETLQKQFEYDINVLKGKIIEYGLKGKLTKQLFEDGEATSLFEEIQKQDLNLSKVSKTALSVTPDDIPFEIPKNWIWVRLASLYEINPKVEANANDDAAFIPMEKVSPGYTKDFAFEIQKWNIASKNHTKFQNDDVAFAKISPCFENRKSFIAKDLPNGIGGGTTELIVLRQKLVYPDYTYYVISDQRFIDAGSLSYNGIVGQQRVKSDVIKNYLVPLPPFAEQIRIAKRIDDLLCLITKRKTV